MGKCNIFCFSWISKLYFTFEEKHLTLSDMVLNVCTENIYGNYIINGVE